MSVEKKLTFYCEIQTNHFSHMLFGSYSTEHAKSMGVAK